jgi:hypothetical protein
MSHENVDRFRRLHDAFNRRDRNAFLALIDPDVRHVPLAAAIDGDYLGHDGMRTWWTSLLALARLRSRGHGTAGGAPFDMAVWQVAEWRDGKLVWSGTHPTEAEALEALASREGTRRCRAA